MSSKKGDDDFAIEPERKPSASKSKSKKKKPSEKLSLEYFEPINRSAAKLAKGDGFRSKIYKKVSGIKEETIGSTEDNYEKFGRRSFVGAVQKMRGNIQGDMHARWVVMRGWNLFWYRKPDDTAQKGVLTIPSQDIVVRGQPEKVGFLLPKEDGKDGKGGNRAMSFGDDIPTRIFRCIMSFMIKYKVYAEQT